MGIITPLSGPEPVVLGPVGEEYAPNALSFTSPAGHSVLTEGDGITYSVGQNGVQYWSLSVIWTNPPADDPRSGQLAVYGLFFESADAPGFTTPVLAAQVLITPNGWMTSTPWLTGPVNFHFKLYLVSSDGTNFNTIVPGPGGFVTPHVTFTIEPQEGSLGVEYAELISSLTVTPMDGAGVFVGAGIGGTLGPLTYRLKISFTIPDDPNWTGVVFHFLYQPWGSGPPYTTGNPTNDIQLTLAVATSPFILNVQFFPTAISTVILYALSVGVAGTPNTAVDVGLSSGGGPVLTPWVDVTLYPPPVGPAGIEYAPEALTCTAPDGSSTLTVANAGITYAVGSDGTSYWGITIHWTNPTGDADFLTLGAYAIYYQSSTAPGFAKPVLSAQVLITNLADDGLLGYSSGVQFVTGDVDQTFTLFLVSVSVNNQSDSIQTSGAHETPSVTFTVGPQTGPSGEENTSLVTSLAVAYPGWYVNAQGQQDYPVDVTFDIPDDATWVGVVLHFLYPPFGSGPPYATGGSNDITLTGIVATSPFQIDVTNFPTSSLGVILYAVSIGTQGPNTVQDIGSLSGGSPLLTPWVDVILGPPPLDSTGIEYCNNVTISSITLDAPLEQPDGSYLQNCVVSATPPSDPSWGSFVVIARVTDTGLEVNYAGGNTFPYTFQYKPTAYVVNVEFYVLSADVNGRSNELVVDGTSPDYTPYVSISQGTASGQADFTKFGASSVNSYFQLVGSKFGLAGLIAGIELQLNQNGYTTTIENSNLTGGVGGYYGIQVSQNSSGAYAALGYFTGPSTPGVVFYNASNQYGSMSSVEILFQNGNGYMTSQMGSDGGSSSAYGYIALYNGTGSGGLGGGITIELDGFGGQVNCTSVVASGIVSAGSMSVGGYAPLTSLEHLEAVLIGNISLSTSYGAISLSLTLDQVGWYDVTVDFVAETINSSYVTVGIYLGGVAQAGQIFAGIIASAGGAIAGFFPGSRTWPVYNAIAGTTLWVYASGSAASDCSLIGTSTHIKAHFLGTY